VTTLALVDGKLQRPPHVGEAARVAEAGPGAAPGAKGTGGLVEGEVPGQCERLVGGDDRLAVGRADVAAGCELRVRIDERAAGHAWDALPRRARAPSRGSLRRSPRPGGALSRRRARGSRSPLPRGPRRPPRPRRPSTDRRSRDSGARSARPDPRRAPPPSPPS